MTRPTHGTSSIAEPLDPDLLPWEQQPTESSDAYRSFRAYLEMEKRNVTKAPGDSVTHSRRWSWPYRALEFDRHMARVDFEEMEKYRREMNRRHREAGRALQAQVYKWLARFEERPDLLEKLQPRDAIRMFEVAVKVERDAASVGDLPTATDSGYRPAGTGVSDEPAGEDDDDTVTEQAGIAEMFGADPSHEMVLADSIADALVRVAAARGQ